MNINNKNTEQLLAEIEQLKQDALVAEGFHDSIVNSAVDAIITITEEGIINSWNLAAKRMFGYEFNEIVNKNISQIIPEKYLKFKNVKGIIKVWLKKKTGKTTELVAQKKDGTEFPIELSVAKWESVKGIQITGIIRDISKRKKAFDELQKLYLALKKLNEIVFTTDTNGLFSFINEQFTKTYGYEPHEVIGIKTPRILKSPKNKRDFKLFWETLLKKESISSLQYTNITKFGEIIDVEGSADPILDNNNEIIGFIGVQRDLTERMATLDNLKEALKRAQESDKLKSEFLANMSHELRTPLNSIIGLSSLIDRDMTLDDIIEFNQIIFSSGEHLLEIVENLFDISLIETNQLKAVKRNFQLESVLIEVDSLMRIEQRKLKKTHLDFNLILEPEHKNFIINTDKIKFIKIFKSLLKNALHFTEEGYINYGYNLYYIDNKPTLKFFIKDTGIGIILENQNTIFDMFRQVNK